MGFGPRFEIPHIVDDKPITVIMRAPQDGDAAALAAMLDDYIVHQFIEMDGSPTPKDEEEWLEKVRQDHDNFVWLVSVKHGEGEELVGTTNLYNKGWNRLTSGIVFGARQWWGKGIASKTHEFRTWFAFMQIGAYAIDSVFCETNVASGRALAKMGYIECGRRWKCEYTGGRWHDHIQLVCHNPLAVPILWPAGDEPEVVREGVAKTQAVIERVSAIIQPR